ncbi:hypothetical protein VOLCADRAFT_100039, partial [Volvox carteri f. nagariensis]
PQKLDNSSVHREARFAQFNMPLSAEDVLAILGDTTDAEFPIYRTGDYGGLVYTLCTVLYDLAGRRMMVYRGNPRNGMLGSVLNLDTLVPVEHYRSGEGLQKVEKIEEEEEAAGEEVAGEVQEQGAMWKEEGSGAVRGKQTPQIALPRDVAHQHLP